MRVFISYSRKDMNAAKHVAEVLKDRDVEVFIDYQNMVGGPSFLAQIGREIRECDHLLLVLSVNSAMSWYVTKEVEAAQIRGKSIIVLRLDDTTMPDAFFFLESSEHILAYELTRGEVLRRAALVKLWRSIGISVDSSSPSRDPIFSILPPPFEWCPIPAGRPRVLGAIRNVPDFVMARYPITNAQFDIFARAEHGYQNPKWWDFSNEAETWRRQNVHAASPAFYVDDHPRTNVTWYEAVAFCVWLSTYVIRMFPKSVTTLPSETQWQWAAVGESTWDYPWGPVFDPSRCNHSVGRGSRGTSPVTAFAGKGDSPYHVSDMSGNVREWCLNPAFDIESSSLRGEQPRAIRGGSWSLDNPAELTGLYRAGASPSQRGADVGFRIIRIFRSDS